MEHGSLRRPPAAVGGRHGSPGGGAGPPLTTAHQPTRRPTTGLFALLVAVPALLFVPWVTDGGPTYLWPGLPAIVLVGAIDGLLLAAAVRRQEDERLARLLPVAFAAKLLGTLARYYFVFTASAADAFEYSEEGTRLAESYRQLDLGTDLGRQFVGTGFVRAFTGVVYALLGANRLVATLVFASLAWWGLYLFVRAFALALPDADTLRYSRLVLLLPSLLFWPSSIGKESLMVFALGLTAFGAARLLRFQRGGMLLVLLGSVGTGIIRPHITLAAFAAVFAATLVRRGEGGRPVDPVRRLLGLAVLLVIGGTLLARTASFFGVDELSSASVEKIQAETGEQTGQGGSEFEPVVVRTPLDLPLASVTVLFRPFPNEASSTESRIASAESLLLAVLLLLSAARLRSLPRLLVTAPYAVFAVVFAALFVFGFSAIGNFGILARQRAQVLPFVVVLLALPALPGRVSARRT